ncbi:MAG: ABC transporter permease [Myxococcota bacterium]
MVQNLRELYRYRALLWSLTLRELKARYRASILGFLWTFLNPTLLMLVYALVFSVYMRQQIPRYTYFMFVGLLPWIFFASSVTGGTSAISDRRDLLTKVRFPAQVLPATVISTNLCNYLLSLPLMVLLGVLYGDWPSWHAVFFPAVTAIQTLFVLALVFALSAINVRFRDLQHVIGNLVTLWFFLTPVLYSARVIPERYRELLVNANPMAVIITSYQAIFYDHQLPPALPLASVAVLSTGVLWVATRIFEARREEFAELI